MPVKPSSKNDLVVDGISLSFGGVSALSNFSVEAKPKEILAIIGPNGAGKTCILNCINGFYRPQMGRILFHGQDITKLPTHRIAGLGIARTFQNIELYTGLTALDNLMAARHIFMKQGMVSGSIYVGKAHREELRHREAVEDIIDLLELEPIRKKVVGMLPYGQRKKVELGRALALEPRILLLDEPMAGMNVEEKEDMARFIIDIHELKDIPIILVEHDMGVVMDISDRVAVVDFGVKIAEGSPEEVRDNPGVIKAYMGSSAALTM
ncbi:MAG: ABC transporter ATP-binding protein [Desulfatiglans sp.]|jgi:branched-chain amino acid transport system ATP-binding protein|nr:ABC transporter ATP-binding protein [Thermodesulfobacteriota bacterium]MEE4353749.1 ABC transporter ATP-binding protein [Desulfatiglans sp.]